MEHDAYFLVDPVGTEGVGGGLNLTLRDMARFGEMMRLDGRFNGQQLVAKSVIDDIRRGGASPTRAGGSYRNMWWISHEYGRFAAVGIHGQALFIYPDAEVVIARFASQPVAAYASYAPTTTPAFDALVKHLNASK